MMECWRSAQWCMLLLLLQCGGGSTVAVEREDEHMHVADDVSLFGSV